MIKVYVTKGLGIGCHEEVAHAYQKAGANTEIIHIKQLLSGDKRLTNAQIINLCGGFLHGDILGAGMCAANELEHSVIMDGEDEKRVKDLLIQFKERGNMVYGQCNGFQLMVKTGLLPGLDNDYSRQTVTLTHNDCGNYRVDFVLHKVKAPRHFAFNKIDEIYLWCRHGEGKIMFYSPYGSIDKEQSEITRQKVNDNHVLLSYVNPNTHEPTEEFPYNPNGSVDAIAGLYNQTFIGHMAHTEVGIYITRDPRWPKIKDSLRRKGFKAADLTDKMLEGPALQVFRNLVGYFR